MTQQNINSCKLLACGASGLLCLAGGQGISHAQENLFRNIQLDTITITATRSERNTDDVPVNIDVVDVEIIEDEGINDTSQLVRRIPGVTVNRQSSGANGFGSFGGFTIRGVGGNRVQITVDGSRTPERIIDGNRDFVDLSFLKTVEIAKGPGSVLWGSDSLGGLVAYETIDPGDILKPGSMMNFRVKTGYDTENSSWDKTLIGAFSNGPKFSMLFGYTHNDSGEPIRSAALKSGGVNGCPRNVNLGATPCNKFDPTDIESHDLISKFVFKPTNNHRFEFTASHFEKETSVDAKSSLGFGINRRGVRSTIFVNDRQRQLDTERQRFALEHKWDIDSNLFDSLKWVVASSPQAYTRKGTRLRTLANGQQEFRFDSLKYSENFRELDVELKSHFNLGNTSHHLTYGFDGGVTDTKYERLDITTNRTTNVVTAVPAGGFNFADAKTTRADLYIQDEIKMFGDRVEFIPGVRFATYEIEPDPNPDYQFVPGKEPRDLTEKALTVNAGLTVKVTDQYSVFGRFAQGFKMPTAQQLFTSLPGRFFNLTPNPDLKPEKVNSYEIGVRGKFSRGKFSVNGFYADYTDFIQGFFFVPNTSPLEITNVNLSSVQIYGIEASAEYYITPNLLGYGSLSYQRGTQKANPTASKVSFNGASPLNGVIGFKYAMPRHNLELDFSSLWSTKVKRRNGARTFKPGAYAVFDANAVWKPTENIKLTASVLNMFNTRYFTSPLGSFNENPGRPDVAFTNPIELQTQPGRTFRIGLVGEY